jgi:hypothetical protein
MTEPYTLDDDDVRALGDIGQLADYILTYPKGRDVQASAQAILAKLATIEGKMGRASRTARRGPAQQDGR